MKTINILLGLTLSAITLSAQTTIGFKVGGNTNYASLSGISDDFLPNTFSYTRLSAGVDVSIPIEKNFTFRPGLSYNEKGFIVKETTSFNTLGIDLPLGVKANTQINYVDASALMQYNYTAPSGFHAYAFAGPYLGYATKGFVQTKANFIIDINVKRFDLNLNDDMYNRYELGLIGGGGLGAKMGKGEIFLDVKYQHGFTNQINDPVIDLGVKNRSVNYSIGYRFNLSTKNPRG